MLNSLARKEVETLGYAPGTQNNRAGTKNWSAKLARRLKKKSLDPGGGLLGLHRLISLLNISPLLALVVPAKSAIY